MNEVIKALLERRSIRKFKPDMPKKEDLDTIIKAGLYAPSGMNKQAAIIIAVTDKAFRDKLAKDNVEVVGGKADRDPFYGAPAVLVVLGKKDVFTSVYDGSLVMGNMLLAAHSLGLGSIWIHRAKEVFETEEYKKVLADLGVEGEWEGIGNCAVGYIDGERPSPAERKENRVFYI